ncbi:MAG: DUF4388 domain-containing protein [Thermoanaerobaculaceae bacterium]|nr:DUF4388 domain-containing protein [Thermoanaerobaculaceae bacterium]
MLDISGTLGRLYLGDLLEWLHLTHATGRLLLSTSDVTRAFDMYCGRIAFASSSRASERLGSWLLHRDLASREVLLRALVVSQTQGELFTSVLERDGGLAHAGLVDAGRALATALVSRLLREDRVRFSFDPTWPVAEHKHIDLEMDCRNLVMQAAYRADTNPPVEAASQVPHTTLDPATLEALFWHIVGELEGELVDAADLAGAHRTFLAVGDLLNRWVVQGPPLLPVGPDDAERVARRLEAGRPVRLEDSPVLAWNLLALVNGLDAPDGPNAASADEAWALAGPDAPGWVRMILANPRWRRDSRSDCDDPFRRATLARVAAARKLAATAGLAEDVAITVAALPMVVLELVATALACSPMTGPALQHRCVHHLLPLVGRAAGTAAGLPQALVAAITLSPPRHPAARFARLVGMAAGELIELEVSQVEPLEVDDDLAAALAAARKAAERAVRARPEPR